jgi:hypothetical protein
MTFAPIDIADFLPGEPATSALGIALYENPIAIAAGDADAPKVVGQALSVFVGAISGTTTITGLDRAKIIVIEFFAPAPVARVRFSANGGSTWGGYQNIGPSVTPGFSTIGKARIDLETGGRRTTSVTIGGATPDHLVNVTALTPVSACNAIEVSGIASADVWCFGGVSP